MSQRVPNYHIHNTPEATFLPSKEADDSPMLDYDVGELTWDNGHLSFHGLGPPRVPSPLNYSVGATSGTLESIVNQATRFHDPKPMDEHVPCFYNPTSMDALVPQKKSHTAGIDTTPLGTRSADGKRVRVAPESARESQLLTMGTSGFTTTTLDDDKSSSRGKPCTKTTIINKQKKEEKKKAGAKSSVSNKKSRDAAIHNQIERERRSKINERMSTLQKLVPYSCKADKASILDEVIVYMNKLQEQVSMMSMPSMMLPMAMHHQQQKFQQPPLVPNPMGLGIGMGMPGLGLPNFNFMNQADATATATAPNIHANMMPNPFVPMTWNASSSIDPRFKSPLIPADPMATFLACSRQQTTMEAYSRMAALIHQQMQQLLPPPNPK